MRNNPGWDDTVVRPVFFAEMLFLSGPLRLNSSNRDIVHEGLLYTGVGQLGEISEYTTTVGVQATSLRLTLIGMPPSVLLNLSNENERRRPVKMSLALVNAEFALLTVPFVWFIGTVDSLVVSVGKSANISVSATSRLINWARAANVRYTHEDQQSIHPTDQGLKFLAGIPLSRLVWGN